MDAYSPLLVLNVIIEPNEIEVIAQNVNYTKLNYVGVYAKFSDNC